MKRIGLLSDTHGFLDPDIFKYFEEVEEIWHAGDVGVGNILADLNDFRPLRAVFGNIDETRLRNNYPEDQLFTLEGLTVLMTHIGGYPGRYNKRARILIDEHQPQLFICGHSHILKVMPDKKRHLLHINPGACGHHGFHKMRTIIRFSIENGHIFDLEVIELGKRGALGKEK